MIGLAGLPTGNSIWKVPASIFAELMGHAEGDIQFTLRNGTLPHNRIARRREPFSVRAFAGSAKAKNGNWKLSAGKLESRDGIYQVSGTASPSMD